ncbi:reverse transcriptase [Caerostris extrusa]|uniref:Reverse transcriptase n=1 Tax=Caerostris extrusa TaxID=172846 RepID=A0AAV4WB25_CAEEX|nr:reverse transcriptase [Caerostris extrusa]
MNPSHAHLTGITTEFRFISIQRLPFGLKNAGASFQKTYEHFPYGVNLPDFDKPFAICTDASKYSLGAVLVQEDESGVSTPQFPLLLENLDPRKNILWWKGGSGSGFGINHFKNYLYGSHFFVYCDQQCLSKLMKLKDQRRVLPDGYLPYSNIHTQSSIKPGRLNLMADYLSRAKYSIIMKTKK